MRKSVSRLLLLGVLPFLLTGCSGGSSSTEDDDGLKPYYEYSDVVFDRTIVDGKMAVYFLRGDASMNTFESNTVCGDSTLIITPDGTTILIDCNMTSCTAFVVAALQRLGISRLDYFINSHPHGDHIGGWSTLLRYIDIGQVYHSGSLLYYAKGNRYVTGFLDALDEKNIPHDTLYAGDQMTFGDVTMDVLWPGTDTDWATCEPSDAEQNNYSIVTKFTYGDSTYMFAGDIETATEGKLVDLYGDQLQSDIAKMNHHGHDTSESAKWLNALQSKVSVAERFAAQSEETIYKYYFRGTTPLYTALDKTVLIYTDGDGTYDVQVEKDRTFYQDVLPEGVENGHFRVE